MGALNKKHSTISEDLECFVYEMLQRNDHNAVWVNSTALRLHEFTTRKSVNYVNPVP